MAQNNLPEAAKIEGKFKQGHTILYCGDGDERKGEHFAVAFGVSSGKVRVGIRWLLENFPKDCWFEVPTKFDIPFVSSLLGKDGADNNEILSALQKLAERDKQ